MTVNRWIFLLIQGVLNIMYWIFFLKLGEIHSIYLELFSPLTHLIFTFIIFITMYKRKVKEVDWIYLLFPSGLMLLSSAATGQLFIHYILNSELGYHLAGVHIFYDLVGRLPLVFLTLSSYKKSSINVVIRRHIAFQYIFLLMIRLVFYYSDADIFLTMIFTVILNEILSFSFVVAYVYFTYIIIRKISLKSKERNEEAINI